MTEAIHDVPLSEIWADDEWNVRGYITPASAASLADDIAKLGQLQPILLHLIENKELGTKYKIVLGHRRFEALKLLSRSGDPKWQTIKARIAARTIDDSEALLMNIQENLERVDLDIMMEAQAITRFKQKWGWDAKRIGKELGKPRRWVEIRLGLMKLPKEIQERAKSGYLTQYEIEKCIDFDTVEQQFEYVREVVDHKLRGTKIQPKKKPEERKKSLVSVMAKGESRSLAEMALVQESLQDSFGDLRHPAAMALAWAMGALSYEEFVEHHVQRWINDANASRSLEGLKPLEFHHHPKIEGVIDAA